MSILNRFTIALMTFLVPMVLVGTASAQSGPGAACIADQCGLGGQIRGQIGDGLPLPISFAPAGGGEVTTVKLTVAGVTTFTVINLPTQGPFLDITIKAVPFTPLPTGLGFVGLGLGQQGQVKPTTNATIMQTTAHPHTSMNPRQLTMAEGLFRYHATGQRTLGVLAFNSEVLAVQTSLTFDNPHPGTTEFGAIVPPRGTVAGVTTLPGVAGGGGPGVFFAGGRPGDPTITFCALGLLNGGTPGNNFNNQCLLAPDGVTSLGGGINGIVRFSKTKNQFGGIVTGRTLGTAQVFFNVNNLVLGDLPCTGTLDSACAFGFSIVDVQSLGLVGGPFGSTDTNAAFVGNIFTGDLGENGTILKFGNVLTTGTSAGVPVPVPFTGQPATSVGFPWTTGMITVSVTQALPVTEKFIRTGTDARDANGNGVVALNSGTLSTRTTSKGNANRTWLTLEIPEPNAIFAASAGLFALFGCHQLVRRRSR